MTTINGILILAITAFMLVGAVGQFVPFPSQPHIAKIDPKAQAVSTDDLHGGCAVGDIFNVTGVVRSEGASVIGEPVAELKTSDPEFSVGLGFPGRLTDRSTHNIGVLGVYAGAHVTVQGTCSFSTPGARVVLRDSKVISE